MDEDDVISRETVIRIALTTAQRAEAKVRMHMLAKFDAATKIAAAQQAIEVTTKAYERLPHDAKEAKKEISETLDRMKATLARLRGNGAERAKGKQAKKIPQDQKRDKDPTGLISLLERRSKNHAGAMRRKAG